MVGKFNDKTWRPALFWLLLSVFLTSCWADYSWGPSSGSYRYTAMKDFRADTLFRENYFSYALTNVAYEGNFLLTDSSTGEEYEWHLGLRKTKKSYSIELPSLKKGELSSITYTFKLEDRKSEKTYSVKITDDYDSYQTRSGTVYEIYTLGDTVRFVWKGYRSGCEIMINGREFEVQRVGKTITRGRGIFKSIDYYLYGREIMREGKRIAIVSMISDGLFKDVYRLFVTEKCDVPLGDIVSVFIIASEIQ